MGEIFDGTFRPQDDYLGGEDGGGDAGWRRVHKICRPVVGRYCVMQESNSALAK
jgi:hypothetical protein